MRLWGRLPGPTARVGGGGEIGMMESSIFIPANTRIGVRGWGWGGIVAFFWKCICYYWPNRQTLWNKKCSARMCSRFLWRGSRIVHKTGGEGTKLACVRYRKLRKLSFQLCAEQLHLQWCSLVWYSVNLRNSEGNHPSFVSAIKWLITCNTVILLPNLCRSF